MRDAGRSPLHLLLDDRASRDGACGSDRRRRARGPARRPRTLRRREDQGRPGKEGVSPRPGDASAASCANRACGRVRARTVRTARDAGRRGQAREPAGPRVRRLRPAHASGGRSYLCPRRRRLGVRVSAGRPGGQGHRRPFRRAGPGTQAWYWARSPPSTSRRRTSRKQGFAGRKGPQAPLPVF